MARLASFIRDNTESILRDWEAFARSLPSGDEMGIVALRDHAKEMLHVIASDLEQSQTARQQVSKARGKADARDRNVATAAQEHGAGRAESGFTVEQMVAEFRALRATVIRLWMKQGDVSATDLEDMIRFNEAIDQAIAESITRFSHEIGQAKERFLAILGHDLRTPLSAVLASSVFMLENGRLAEPNLTLTSGIATSARRMTQLVSDLLDFTRTRFGDTIPIIREAADMRTVIHGVVAEVGASHPKSTVQIETSGGLQGVWDPHRIAQALTNLIANAVQHSSDDFPIKVVVRGAADAVVISVQSHGPVIPRKDIPRLFEPMKNGRKGASDRRHLGLGLYIVDKIVTAHDGTIAVRSTREGGTVFTIHLPRELNSTITV